jgi:hypothetical protein
MTFQRCSPLTDNDRSGAAYSGDQIEIAAKPRIEERQFDAG